jgi:hypothetical protein
VKQQHVDPAKLKSLKAFLYKAEPFYKDTPPVGPVWDFSYDGIMTSLVLALIAGGIGPKESSYLGGDDRF